MVKNLKEKKNKGLLLTSSLATLFILISLLVVWIQKDVVFSLANPKVLYQSQEENGDQLDNLASSKLYALKLDAIYGSIALTSQDEDLYVVKSGDKYFVLVAAKNNKRLAQLAERSEDLSAQPSYIYLEAEPDYSGGLSSYLPTYLQGSPLEDVAIDTSNYLIYQPRWKIALGHYGIPSLIFAFGLLLLFLGFKQRQRNVATYEKLYREFPELQKDLNLLLEEADYLDEELRIAIYKDFLISYKANLLAVNLKETVWLYNYIMTNYYSFVAVNKQIMLMAGSKLDGKYKLLGLPLKNLRKSTQTHIDDLMSYSSYHYPHLMLGFTSENQKAFKNLKKQAKEQTKQGLS